MFESCVEKNEEELWKLKLRSFERRGKRRGR
jgi:hypothetical protein